MLNQPLSPLSNNDDLKITIVGFGNIGKQILFSLLHEHTRNLCVNIMEPNPNISGSVYDLAPAAVLNKRLELSFNDHTIFEESNIILYCAGTAIPKGENRKYKCTDNLKIARDVFKDFKPTTLPLIIVISNPHEAVCNVISKSVSIPKNHIIGLGTLVDNMRFEYFLSMEASVSIKLVSGWILGGHGELNTAIISHSAINHQPLEQVLSHEQIFNAIHKSQETADMIKETQDSSYYSAAKAALFVMKCYYSLQQQVLPLAIYDSIRDVYYSVPVKVGKKEIIPVSNFELNAEESARFESLKEQISNECRKSREELSKISETVDA